MAGVEAWFNGLPKFTRFWFTGTIVVSNMARFGLLPSYYLVLLWKPFFNDFQIWRPITALFFYPIGEQTGFHFIINCYLLLHYSRLLESSATYATRPADYALMLLINWILCSVAAFFIGTTVLMDSMILSILYIWSDRNQDQIVHFWFGTQFHARYLTVILVILNLILSGGALAEVTGATVGFIYCTLKFKYPENNGGSQLLPTPAFLERLFPPT